MISKRPASGSAGSKAIKMARPEQPAKSDRAARSASRAKTAPNNNSNVEVGSKETLARPVVTPVITSPPLKVEAVKVKKLQKRKGVRVMTTKGQLCSAGMSNAQAKSIPAKATRGHMLYGTILGRDHKGIYILGLSLTCFQQLRRRSRVVVTALLLYRRAQRNLP